MYRQDAAQLLLLPSPPSRGPCRAISDSASITSAERPEAPGLTSLRLVKFRGAGRSAEGSGVHYDTYLRLDRLLAARNPRSDTRNGDIRAAEHYFIIVHQISKLWLKQALVDLHRAQAVLRGPGDNPTHASALVYRASACVDYLTDCLHSLDHLPANDFARFRAGLDSASGAQSRQMRELMTDMGLPQGRSPLLEAFMRLLSGEGLSLARLDRASPAGELAESLCCLSVGVWRWQTAHLELVVRMIGEAPGTGGTAGVNWLRSRIGRAFPELQRWRADADLARAEVR
ncbi:tryptophan 2,3-dioxygenase family protein [Streptomyces sp. NPDC008222]|uniref:tryptophan 2,3-dioxygenase family protein n=1 Tax=Streptomyces sp. NPDC008222 TaxID=3364820 RepID=UPI0036E92443